MEATVIRTTAPLKELLSYGQSIWLDYIRRSLITSGELKRLIDEGLRGVTSNPSIFEKAIVGSTDYQDILLSPESQTSDAKSLYEKIAIRDIQGAADLLAVVYQESKGRDGYVSLEVSPLLASDMNATLKEARRLWKSVNRKNLMIKVPATPEGIRAVRELISEGINVNVTLLFSQTAYEQVALSFISGLEDRAARGEDISRIGSVASFFVSRIDSAVDELITERARVGDGRNTSQLEGLKGRVAISNAKLAYHRYQELFTS
ncbi:MAG: transaldolase family protein, partial [Candidatus Acidiferrales bacterium]